jgi:hypothetical protein
MYSRQINVEEFIPSAARADVLSFRGDMTMLLFLAGIIVGAIFGITLIAILHSGAVADEWMEATLKEMDPFPSSDPKIITTKN